MKAQCLSLDRISSLPENILENILCLVPLQDAMRTSILSRTWRYIWTKIPKLEFNMKFKFDESTDEDVLEEAIVSQWKKMVKRFEMFYVIHQVLLMHQGPIHEFSLSMDVDKTSIEIDHIISYLSRNNAVKKLTLYLDDEDSALYWIPSSIFSLHHLVDLYLEGCDLNHQPTFNGFGSLETLYLRNVYISDRSLLHLLSNCPALKTVTLLLHNEHIICDENCTIIELIECLPMVEHFTTWSWILECYALDLVRKVLPTLLIHLKYFYLDYFSCYRTDGLHLLVLLIRCSPNLEKFTIMMTEEHFSDEINSILKDYSDIWLEHLQELEILGFGNLEPDLKFLKFILAKSPELKNVRLYFDNVEKSLMLPTCLTCGKNQC